MGKEIKVVCDSCGNEKLMGASYYTVSIRKIVSGKQKRENCTLCDDGDGQGEWRGVPEDWRSTADEH